MSSAVRFTPSSLNWTPATPTLSEAVADTVTNPVTVALFAGAVRVTDGGVVSSDVEPFVYDTYIEDIVAELPSGVPNVVGHDPKLCFLHCICLVDPVS